MKMGWTICETEEAFVSVFGLVWTVEDLKYNILHTKREDFFVIFHAVLT
jgi:hypothetical protein